ncbi:MAG: hypothetical protein KA521_10190 [Crocinitomicaceae bacterium]|nr:hypothetical protein [Crocinitomicaceae bacterium]
MKNQIHLQVGRAKHIALVFSCPGRHEELNGGPVMGKTGENLSVVLQLISGKRNLPKEIELNDLRITNAWDGVLYLEKDSRTEANLNKTEIYSERNLLRLETELQDINCLILCFGYKAHNAVLKIKDRLIPEIKIVRSSHLSLQAINRKIKRDINGKLLVNGDSENMFKRLEVLSSEILKKL